MAEEPTSEAKGKENFPENSGEVSESHHGQSRFSRVGENSSISDWIAAKEKRRADKAAKRSSGRNGFGSGVGAKPLKRTPLKPVSKKQQKKLSDYARARKVHYSDESNRSCFLCGRSDHLSVHHIAKRGTKIADTDQFVTLCLIGDYMDNLYPDSNHSHTGGCHAWIEANKSIARELGLLE